MDAFGRMIAVSVATLSIVFSLFFYRTASVRWQKEESVRSMVQAYGAELLQERTVSLRDWNAFRKQLNSFGNYRAELVIYERKRFENANGRLYLYTQRYPQGEDTNLTEGSYVRIVVTEDGKETLSTVLFGAGSTIFAGGRVS